MVQIMESMDFMVLGCLGHLDMDPHLGTQMVSMTSYSLSMWYLRTTIHPVCPFGIPYMCTPYGYTMYRYHPQMVSWRVSRDLQIGSYLTPIIGIPDHL